MACCYGLIGGSAALVVLIQVIRRVMPWIYENFVGPLILGSKVNPASMGKWACK